MTLISYLLGAMVSTLLRVAALVVSLLEYFKAGCSHYKQCSQRLGRKEKLTLDVQISGQDTTCLDRDPLP